MSVNIHDNFVYALSIHLEQQTLILHTQYRDGPGPHDFIDVCFSGVIAHHFEHVAGPSILLDIETVPAEWIVQHWRDHFEHGIHYGWPPLEHRDLDELCRLLREQNILGFQVLGSCGLDGFVLASGMLYRQPRTGGAFPGSGVQTSDLAGGHSVGIETPGVSQTSELNTRKVVQKPLNHWGKPSGGK
ncbi:MAG: hypothetical protein JWM11_5185, partial [Planctomycetaceae bacterium]|nr:hypothetical protein [Planctomycetaceae bacterium]